MAAGGGEIKEKLDGFIRKYYINELLKGAILSLGLLLGVFIFLTVGEYLVRFGTTVRSLLFYGFWALLGGVLFYYILRPLMGLYKLGKSISYEQAAGIIGNHFSEVKDKLLNLLQLEEMQQSAGGNALLLAGIEQKTKELRPVPFTGAINREKNRKYLRYAGIPVALLAAILLLQSSIITDGAQRLISYNKVFKEKAPFSFVLLNRENKIPRGSDYEVQLKLTGKSIPDEVFIVYKNQKIKLVKNEKGVFTYLLGNVQKNETFNFSAAGFDSDNFTVEVLPVPGMLGAYLEVNYPAYTGRKPERIDNLTDMTVPEGTEIIWNLKTRDASQLYFTNNEKAELYETPDETHTFKVKKRILGNSFFKISLKNKKTAARDTLRYNIQTQADQAPSISVEKKDDSTNLRQFFLLGEAADDYGVAKVNLVYRFKYSLNAAKMALGNKVVPLSGAGVNTSIPFVHTLNMDALGMAPSDEVEYFIEAWDNDAIHGSKVSRTEPVVLRRESIDEIRQNADATGSSIKNNMSKAMQQAKELAKETQKVQSSMSNSKNINSFEQKQKLEDFLKKQLELNKKVDEIKKDQQKLQQQQNEFMKKDEDYLEKQKKLEELFKMMQNPEVQKMLQKMQEMLDSKMNPEELKKELDNMEKSNTDLSKEMDKLMEQFKQMEVEQKHLDNIDRMNELSEKQQKLAEKTEKNENKSAATKEELKKEQDKLNKEFEELKKDIKETDELNKGLEKPMNLDMGKEEQQGAESEMQNAKENLDKGKNSKASGNQKNAAQKMKEAAEKMKKSLEDEKSKQIEEDYATLRQLLENLVDASVEQEEVFTELSKTREISPKVIELNQRQMKLKEQCGMLEDSLWALAKRQPMLNSFVTKEIKRINDNMGNALESLKVRELAGAAVQEQYVMTGLNNLAVMLMESLQNMQQQMNKKKDQKPGNGSCKNPGGKGKGKSSKNKPGSKGQLSQGQKELGKMLMEMQKKKAGESQKPGSEGEKGKDDKASKKQTNKEFAEMALIQEALRKQLEGLKKKLSEEGKLDGEVGKQIKQTEEMMKQQEKDMVNKKITPEMMKRQKEIETRLLEHEKADLTQDTEEKREAAKPKEVPPVVPPQLIEYAKEKQRQRELLRKSPPELSPYYREKVDEYLRNVR